MGYYKWDVGDVSLDGIDIGVLMAGLYNNALTGGMGLRHFSADIMSPDEGRYIFNEMKIRWIYGNRERWKQELTDIGAYNLTEPDTSRHLTCPSLRDVFRGAALWGSHAICIDYINGRSVKTMFNWNDQGGYMLNFSRFWDYNHMPVAVIIELARKGVSGQVRQGQYLDIQNEARILMESTSKKIIDWDDPENEVAVDTKEFEKLLNQAEARYIEDSSGDEVRRRECYQISYSGNGVLSRGVGTPTLYPNPIPVYDPEQHVARPVRGFPSFARK